MTYRFFSFVMMGIDQWMCVKKIRNFLCQVFVLFAFETRIWFVKMPILEQIIEILTAGVSALHVLTHVFIDTHIEDALQRFIAKRYPNCKHNSCFTRTIFFINLFKKCIFWSTIANKVSRWPPIFFSLLA